MLLPKAAGRESNLRTFAIVPSVNHRRMLPPRPVCHRPTRVRYTFLEIGVVGAYIILPTPQGSILCWCGRSRTGNLHYYADCGRQCVVACIRGDLPRLGPALAPHTSIFTCQSPSIIPRQAHLSRSKSTADRDLVGWNFLKRLIMEGADRSTFLIQVLPCYPDDVITHRTLNFN